MATRRAQDSDDLLFARLVLHYKLLDQQRLNQAIREHRDAPAGRRLADSLVHAGLLTAKQVEQLQNVQRTVQQKQRAQQQPGGANQTPPTPIQAQTATTPAAGARASAGEQPPAAGARASAGEQPAANPAPTAAGAAPDGYQQSRSAASSSTAVALERVLRDALAAGASDVHIHAGAPLRLRLHGQMVDQGSEPLTPEATRDMVYPALSDAQRQELERTGQLDFAYAMPGEGRFRANAYKQQRGVDIVLRAISAAPPSLEELGFPSSLAELVDWHQGMVLVTGPAGCGKSSTMAALLDIINAQRSDHIITIEEPIEYIHPSKSCVVNQRQVGKHTESFSRALRAALREDPDVIGIGELRDLETISLALSAAETGHFVLGTLHTNNAIRTINRLLGVFPPNQQAQIRAMVSESLKAIISQRLLPRQDGQGRVPALEILVVNKAVSNLIRENKTFQIRSILQTGSAQGMRLLDNSLHELVRDGTISQEAARLQAEDPNRFAG